MAHATDGSAAPIRADDFAARMLRLGPFEKRPHLALGVSGGRDSLAMALLAADWAAARQGRVTAVTLDHGLRAESAAEAEQVATWMARRGIPHHTLTWAGSPGGGASEAAARTARYALLEAFCREHGILHLLVGHHRDDQLETRAMRRARASGAFGRAGMPSVRELAHARVLRPLLEVPRVRITATLQAYGQDWVEDPSNRDTRFARARMRMGRSAMASGAREEDGEAARARVGMERALSRIAGRAVAVHPAGFATLDPASLDTTDRETGVRLIANLVTCIGGRVYAPRGAGLKRLAERLTGDGLNGGATLGGCIVRPARDGRVCFMREPAVIEAPRQLMGAEPTDGALDWDGRFRLSFPARDDAGAATACGGEMQLGSVGQFVSQGVPAHPESPRFDTLPHAVRATLPAICRDGHFHKCGMAYSRETGLSLANARFAPQNPVAGAVFATS
ncbi:MAG: tRNA lysidine(34) synthetase TilS [Alphaproteobacteria bacterium]